METKTVAEFNVTTFVLKVAEMAKDGWEFAEGTVPGHFGHLYEAHMVHQGEPPERLTRAEILAKARAAKAEKAKAEEAPAAEEQPAAEASE